MNALSEELLKIIEKSKRQLYKYFNNNDTNTICLIGIGGGGTNILDDIFEFDNKYRFISINSDYNALKNKKSQYKILLGEKSKKGLGCGGNELCGSSIVDKKTKDELYRYTKNIKNIYVIASLGGGVGSGASPEIINYLKTIGKTTIVFSILPFKFEGTKRIERALKSQNKIIKVSDKLYVVDNNKFLHYKDCKNNGMKSFFKTISYSIYKKLKED
ncbi:MAG: hypothetical protein U9R39_09210 [Campylobacterota bacterium]|nr:hypothetical protein [Campylobacterota bacterium]